LLKPFHILDRCLSISRRLTARRGKASGVLLLSCGGLGDTVLFAHVLPRFMALAKEGEKVSVLLRADAAQMAFLFPPGVETVIVDFRRFAHNLAYRKAVSGKLFGAHFRLVVSTDYLRHPHLDEALAAACAAPECVAMEPRPWPKYASALKRNRRIFTKLHDSGAALQDKILRWSRFAGWLTGLDEPPPVALLNEETLPPAQVLERPTVVIQPFSAVRKKQSPPGLYRRILKAVSPSHDVAFTGAPGDLERNPEYKKLIAPPGVTFNSATFEEIVPLLRAAALVVSVDTALMHLAVAVGAPTLCLASAAYVGEIVPYYPAVAPANAHFIYRDMDCRGCLGNCVHSPVDGMYPCVAAISADAVLAEIRKLLD
jgi:ADP-heptose:LPS heptosyltransferase